jgi:adenine deaminase
MKQKTFQICNPNLIKGFYTTFAIFKNKEQIIIKKRLEKPNVKEIKLEKEQLLKIKVLRRHQQELN